MESIIRYSYFILAVLLAWALNFGGCSTSELSPSAVPTPPVYTQVPHPEGSDITDISAIFLNPLAPKPSPHAAPEATIAAIVKDCDAEFLKFMSVTQSVSERTVGVRELIKQDPIHYHWCFYAKTVDLEMQLKNDSFLDEKQKKVLQTYEFLVPVGKAFLAQFRDSRYMRVAVNRYRALSQWLFFRKLELTPMGTVELVQPSNPFGLWRDTDLSLPVLEKYHMVRTPSGQNQQAQNPPILDTTPKTVSTQPIVSTPQSVPQATSSPVVQPKALSTPTLAPVPTAPTPVATPTPMPSLQTPPAVEEESGVPISGA